MSGYGQSGGQSYQGLPGFNGQTQDLGGGLQMRQMGPSTLQPWMRNQGQLKPAYQGGPTPNSGMQMKQMGPSMVQPWMQSPELQMKQMGPSMLPPGMQLPKAWTPPPMPGQPQQPQPSQPNQFPGVPQHILSAITTDPSGRMLYGPDKSPVKFEGGKMVFDSTPFVPGQGQFGQFGAPGAGGFTLDASSGRNMILGGANGPQMYNAEGLVQGSQAPQNFVNYLNSYRR